MYVYDWANLSQTKVECNESKISNTWHKRTFLSELDLIYEQVNELDELSLSTNLTWNKLELRLEMHSSCIKSLKCEIKQRIFSGAEQFQVIYVMEKGLSVLFICVKFTWKFKQIILYQRVFFFGIVWAKEFWIQLKVEKEVLRKIIRKC